MRFTLFQLLALVTLLALAFALGVSGIHIPNPVVMLAYGAVGLLLLAYGTIFWGRIRDANELKPRRKLLTPTGARIVYIVAGIFLLVAAVLSAFRPR